MSQIPGLRPIKIDPTHMPLSVIIQDIEEGRIALPMFQRDFVWDSAKVRDFIDSIYHKFPVGVIILWRIPKDKDLNLDYEYFADDVETNKKVNKPEYLVLDGQQRLTSLLLLVRGWVIQRGGRRIEVQRICFDGNEFRIQQESQMPCRRGIDVYEMVKAFYHYDADAIVELKRRLSENDFEKYRRIAKEMLEYRIPVYIFEAESEEKAYSALAHAFIRINRAGTRISNVELLTSLSIGVLNGDLGRIIRRYYGELKDLGLSQEPYYRLLLSKLGLKQTDVARIPLGKLGPIHKKIEQYIDQKEVLEKYINDIVMGFKTLDEKLNNKLGFGIKDLPSQTVLVPIVYYIVEHNIGKAIDDSILEKMLSWILIATYRGVYTSHVDATLQEHLNIVKNEGVEGLFKLSVYKRIGKDDLVSEHKRLTDARVFPLKVLLALNNARDWASVKIVESDVTIHHIFPKSLVKKNANCLANITLINRSVNSSLYNKPPRTYIKNYMDYLKEHFMPEQEDLYDESKFREFLEDRAQRIIEAGKRFLPDAFE